MANLDDLIEDLSKQIVNGWEKEFVVGKSLVSYSGPSFDCREVKALLEVIKAGWWIAGEKTLEFEKKFAPLLGKQYGVLVNSGTSANMLAAYATKVILGKSKLNVLTCASCFPSTVNPWLQFGGDIAFIDCILKGSYNIDLDKLYLFLADYNNEVEYDVLTFAHVLGNPPNMDDVMEIVNKYKLVFVEDACDALGSKYKSKLLGSFGRFSTCSFFPAHHMTTMEGGFVACDSEEDYKLLKSLRDWGRACWCVGKEQSTSINGCCGRRHSDWLGIGKNVDHRYVFENVGFNLKAIEMQAAVGLEQINKLDKFEEIRNYNYKKLTECFIKYINYFELPNSRLESDVNWFAYPVRVLSNTKFNRDDIVKFLESKKIQTRLLFTGNYLRHPAMKMYNYKTNNYPNSDIVLKDVFMLGVSQVITPKMIRYVCNCIDEYMKDK